MMRILAIVSVILLSGCETQLEAAQQVASGRTVGSDGRPITRMNDVIELTIPPHVTPEVRGARIANPARYPALVYSSSDDGLCTSAIIGPQVLLTAAHCVPDGGWISFTKRGASYEGVCEHAEGYAEDESADYALCEITTPVVRVAFERISTDPSRLRAGQELRLMGFGCTEDDGTGGNDGFLREGEVPITELPSGGDNDIITDGEVGLCMGDSGGPAYLIGPGRQRVQVSVNSRVDDLDPVGTDLGERSYLSSLSTPEAQAFIRSWRADHPYLICGYDPEATGCR